MNQQNQNESKPYHADVPASVKNFFSTATDPNPYSNSSSSRTSGSGQGYITTYSATPDHNNSSNSSDAWLQAYQQQLLQQAPTQQQQQNQAVVHGHNTSYSQGVKPSSPGPKPLEWNIRSSPPPDPNIDPMRQGKLSSINTSSRQALGSSGRQGQAYSNTRTSSSSTLSSNPSYNSRNSSMVASGAAAGGGSGSSGSARSSPARVRPGSDPKPRPSTRVPITPSGYPLMQACSPDELGSAQDPRILANTGSVIAAAAAGAAARAAVAGAAPGSSVQPAPLQWGVKASGPGAPFAAAAGAGGVPKGLGLGVKGEKQIAKAQREPDALWSGSEGSAGHGRTSTSSSVSARDASEALNSRGYSSGTAAGGGRASSGNGFPSNSSSSSYATQARPPSQQMSEGLSRLKQLSSARLASRMTTPPDCKCLGWLHNWLPWFWLLGVAAGTHGTCMLCLWFQ